ncbi:fungal-specific transcription factor domain-containing protein [Fomitopsis serialis]|uniref:fungal-specific transcription factor domain-containing protein n=1 Tax=Fomitopsis serialis TaxID=139415 RepID=UPI00200795AD|nr:fungal-specific transcription factor domain-containing protein [Neoantrodia serialis]KAH9935489.1 fungal-specific transcription factor domain-containing protein [Neoantrodia serialis]
MLRLDPFDSDDAEIHLRQEPQFATQYTTPVSCRTAQTPYAAAETPFEDHRSKKRRIDRACDFCRRRKTKCDGPKMHGNVCTNCIQTGRTCTYVIYVALRESSKPRGPPKAYVVALEDRIEQMEALLKRLRPEADFTTEIGPPVIRVKTTGRTEGFGVASSSHNLLPLAAAIPRPGSPSGESNPQGSGFQRSSPPGPKRSRKLKSRKSCPLVDPQMAYVTDEPSSTSSLSESEEEDSAVELSLVQGITQLTLHGLRPANVASAQAVDGQWRFHGKSSSFKLINTARELKQRHLDEVTGSSLPSSPARSSPEQARPGSRTGAFAPRRAHYWDSLPWEISFEGADYSVTPPFIMSYFPPLDLAESLIELYFARNNSLFPLLHRPTFQKQWRSGLYKVDVWFACVCMGLFAVASRWSDDPRILPDGTAPTAPDGSDNGAWALAGWTFVDVALGVLNLMGMYFRGTIGHAESWTLISIGIIKAQDVGAHRRKVYGRKPTVEEELWKRTIWHLIAIDRLGSLLIGRPCCSRDEDFDLDLPMEVDDEYWETDDPDLAFQQPPGKPAIMTAFVYWVRLSQISAFVLRTLYVIGRFKQPLGLVGPRWREQVIERLNKALLEWIESLPPHLRWSPEMDNDVFASQSAMLYLTYYIVQITIYKPFSLSHGLTEGSLAALAICANAAKAGTRILEVLLLRGLPRYTVAVHFSFVYAGVLLVNLWAQIAKDAEQMGRGSMADDSAVPPALEEQARDLFSLLGMLSSMRPRWELARQAFDDIMQALPPSLLPIAMARFEPTSEESQAAEEPAVVYNGDSGADEPPYRFYYPSAGPSSYAYSSQSQAAEAAPSIQLHSDHPYMSNNQPERPPSVQRPEAWHMPAYAMGAFGHADPTHSSSGEGIHINSHDLPLHDVRHHRPTDRGLHMASSMSGIGGQTSSHLPHIMGGGEAGYGELPYVKVERSDDVVSSHMLCLEGGYQHQHHFDGEDPAQWRRGTTGA